MQKIIIRDSIITGAVLGFFFGICLLMHILLNTQTMIPVVFILAVFLISCFTTGYVYGIIVSFISVLANNYAFTFPHFQFNFTISENLISTIIILIVAIMTGMMTTQIKKHEKKKREDDTARIHANLLRSISHDIRTPLTTIYGSCSTLLECGNQLSKSERINLISGIKEDSEWLIDMVENLLSVTKLENGGLKLKVTETSVEELMDVALSKFYRRYPRQMVRLTLPEEYVSVLIDPILIEQVILNIMENSMKHASGMSHIDINISCEDEWVRFDISDDGCGIDSGILSRLFKETIECGLPGIPADGKEVKFTRTEYQILIILAQNPGKLITYDEIIHQVWNWSDEGSIKKLQVNMANIRKK